MSKITAMYIRLSMEDEDVSLNQKGERVKTVYPVRGNC